MRISVLNLYSILGNILNQSKRTWLAIIYNKIKIKLNEKKNKNNQNIKRMW